MDFKTFAFHGCFVLSVYLLTSCCCCCCTFHIHINIVVVQVIRPLQYFPRKYFNLANYVLNSPVKSVPARTALCAPPVLRKQILLPLLVFNKISIFSCFYKIMILIITCIILRKQFILHTFALPKIDQISQQQNFHDFWNRRSRARGVAKINFRTPMLHGSRFFF